MYLGRIYMWPGTRPKSKSFGHFKAGASHYLVAILSIILRILTIWNRIYLNISSFEQTVCVIWVLDYKSLTQTLYFYSSLMLTAHISGEHRLAGHNFTTCSLIAICGLLAGEIGKLCWPAHLLTDLPIKKPLPIKNFAIKLLTLSLSKVRNNQIIL